VPADYDDYYRARYYSPTLHRFIAEDPLRITQEVASDPFLPSLPHVKVSDDTAHYVQALNSYSYAVNSPVVYADPSGLFPWLILCVEKARGSGCGPPFTPPPPPPPCPPGRQKTAIFHRCEPAPFGNSGAPRG
jgi:hypothetical protein